MTPRPPRVRRPTLRAADEQRLAPLARSLDEAMESIDGVVQDLEHFVEAVDSERIALDGTVLEELGDDDSLVTHIEAGLALSQAARS